jgi:hypothetical protein
VSCPEAVTNAGRLISGGGFDVLIQIDWKFIVYTDLSNARSSAKPDRRERLISLTIRA